MGSGRLLVVEDDQEIRRSLRRALRMEGYEVTTAEDGMAGLEQLSIQPADAIILDVMMPRLDGLGVARHLRALGDRTPILMLTARHDISNRVEGLDAGADDYMVKPFALDELLARIRALLRRSGATDSDHTLQLADLTLNPSTRQVHRADREIQLTKTEFDLLELLLVNSRIVLSRDVIMGRIWGYTFETSSNPLEVHVGYVRRKLEAGGEPRLIHTVRGVGYVAREP
ncbi:response regulator transcription factor [Candidatus Spongiisocius sp.]|uniref:response regulator transcription factor n=1 Tax=Candidatus Spongiisocius sp. TaxID=3101273 RepID=UPI003B5CDFF0